MWGGNFYMRKNEEDQSTMLLRYGKSVLLGGVGSVLLCLLFLFLASVGISRGLLEAGQHDQIIVITCIFSSFLGGMFAVRSCPARGLFVGIAVGTVLFLIQLTSGILLYDTLSLDNGGIGMLCGDLCGGAAAGILGRGGKRHTRKPKKRNGR